MFNLLRKRNLALLTLANIISLTGDFMLRLALPFWIYQTTGSTTATGIMFTALLLPGLLVAPFAGVFVDRLNRRTLMIVSDLLRVGIMLCYFWVNGPAQLWLIYILAFLEACVSQFFEPAVQALVPSLVTEEELTAANSLLMATTASAQLIGPALGGVLIALIGLHGIAALDTVTYLVSAILIALMRVPATVHNVVASETIQRSAQNVGRQLGTFFQEFVQGVRFVWNSATLRAVFLAATFIVFGMIGFQLLIIPTVTQVWHSDARGLGLLMSADGIGTLLGAALVGNLAARLSPRMLIVLGGISGGLILLAMFNQSTLAIAIVLYGISGMLFVAIQVGAGTSMQLASLDENRGRVAALFQTIFAISGLLASLFFSSLATILGTAVLLDIAALAVITCGVVALFMPKGASPVKLPEAELQLVAK
ncbi:MAG: MFS transporter [Chloroflexi bacterium]|nr:MFS transporter [Chloroflexota bacterium]